MYRARPARAWPNAFGPTATGSRLAGDAVHLGFGGGARANYPVARRPGGKMDRRTLSPVIRDQRLEFRSRRTHDNESDSGGPTPRRDARTALDGTGRPDARYAGGVERLARTALARNPEKALWRMKCGAAPLRQAMWDRRNGPPARIPAQPMGDGQVSAAWRRRWVVPPLNEIEGAARASTSIRKAGWPGVQTRASTCRRRVRRAPLRRSVADTPARMVNTAAELGRLPPPFSSMPPTKPGFSRRRFCARPRPAAQSLLR